MTWRKLSRKSMIGQITGKPVTERLAGSVAAAFSEANGEAWVQDAFGNAQLSVLDNALVFPAPEPVLAYLESHPAWLALGEAEKIRGRAALRTVLESRFLNGSWTVSKRTVFIRAIR